MLSSYGSRIPRSMPLPAASRIWGWFRPAVLTRRRRLRPDPPPPVARTWPEPPCLAAAHGWQTRRWSAFSPVEPGETMTKKERAALYTVMAGLDPAIHVDVARLALRRVRPIQSVFASNSGSGIPTWMAGSSPGHDEGEWPGQARP